MGFRFQQPSGTVCANEGASGPRSGLSVSVSRDPASSRAEGPTLAAPQALAVHLPWALWITVEKA